MAEQALSRRGFLAATGCVAATVAAGYSGFSDWQKAYAAKGDDGLVMAGHSACNGCFSKCGYSAYTKDGRLNKIVGDAAHPYGKGKLCARGYGYSQIVYNENRLTDPLRRTSDGKFEKITWDEAYSEISAKVKQIIKESGPSALALIETGVVVTDFYAKRFLTALGSANTYTHGAACNLARNSGLAWSVGGAWGTDFGNAKCVMFIGRSYADGVRPGSLAGMKAGHDKGAYIVMVDPRYNNSMNFVDEWVPINPGTDLAFVLAMSNYIITNDLYDHEFIENYTEGFDEWAQAIRTYTPEWAAKITGIDKDTIIRLAKMFAENAPKASIESGWRGATGVSYFNSGECARAIALFNAILGNYNRKGGSMFAPGIGFGKLEDPKFAAPPAASGSQLGHAELPLAITSMGSNIFLAQQIEKGKVRGMFFCQSNMAFGYSNPAKLAEILGKLELCVVIDVHMSETALCATHILPDTSYLERNDLPWGIAGMPPTVTLRSKVLEVVHPNTRPQDQIFTELAEACGVGQYFRFTIDELADAQLRTVGHTLAELREKGNVTFPERTVTLDGEVKFGTKSGKAQFTYEDCTKMGLTASPTWVAPKVMPEGDQFRLIGGKQAIHSHGQTLDIPDLINITKDYDLTRVWINAQRAAELGIEDGDEVEIYNELATGRIRAKVTQRLNPTCLFLPSNYGCKSPYQTNGYGVGLNIMDFVPFHMDPYYGSCASQETLVRIRKVGA